MGLGKTLQLISWLCHLQAQGQLAKKAALIIAPASLIDNWQEELNKFAPQLRRIVLHPERLKPSDARLLYEQPAWLLKQADVALTTYGIATRLSAEALGELPALILDEAQAIKNASSQRSQALLQLRSARRVALSGTPVENSLDELYSLMHFLNPGLLGSARGFAQMCRQMGNDFAPLRRLISPFILRRLKSSPKILPELPTKTEQIAYCYLSPEQTQLYAQEVESMKDIMQEPDPQARLALVLPMLTRLKQICNHPAQYLGEPHFDPQRSGKMQRLAQLAAPLAAQNEPLLIFTQYRAMIEPLMELMGELYGGRPGLCLHGGTPMGQRQQLVKQFQAEEGPPFMLLSLKAAGTGLTLTRASHVIHFDRWWNPAVEAQASDRAHRMGQKRAVFIHPMVCRGTLEQNIHDLLQQKKQMADALLTGGVERWLMGMDAAELMQLVMPS